MPLDHYCSTNKISRIDLIKIDAQGYEPQVLRGGSESLRRWHPRILIEYDPYWLTRAGSSGSELLSILHELGYSIMELNRGRLVQANPASELVNLHCI